MTSSELDHRPTNILQSPHWELCQSLDWEKEGVDIPWQEEALPTNRDRSLTYDLICRDGTRLIGRPLFAQPFDGSSTSGWLVRVGQRDVVFSTMAIIAWKIHTNHLPSCTDHQ